MPRLALLNHDEAQERTQAFVSGPLHPQSPLTIAPKIREYLDAVLFWRESVKMPRPNYSPCSTYLHARPLTSGRQCHRVVRVPACEEDRKFQCCDGSNTCRPETGNGRGDSSLGEVMTKENSTLRKELYPSHSSHSRLMCWSLMPGSTRSSRSKICGPFLRRGSSPTPHSKGTRRPTQRVSGVCAGRGSR